MAREGYWADPPIRPERFVPNLEQMIGNRDQVRLFKEVLDGVDWSSWEEAYRRSGRGQPPIHPRYIAAAVVYGMYRGIRSSRKLEEACNYRVDFMWLLSCRRIDHTTFAKFRTRFHKPLKDLFRQIGNIAINMGLIQLCTVAFDGTRVKANNSRYKTRTRAGLEEKLRALDQLFEELTSQTQAIDEKEQGSQVKLPEELANVQERRQKVLEALERAKAEDENRRQQGIDPGKNPAQVPLTDSDARVMPNKEGGYAPNYTPTATTDASGFIVDCDVLSQVNETPGLVEAIDRIEENFGKKPENLLTDAGNNSGSTMEAVQQRGIKLFTPVDSQEPKDGNPAYREDPTQPVPSSQWDKLSRNSAQQLDKSCFVYEREKDQYYCPQGKTLSFEQIKRDRRRGTPIERRVYRCPSCAGCPLAAACLYGKNTRGRTITRDQYQDLREQTAARMAQPAARELYNQRPRIAETPFGIIKSVIGLRQFLLRGLEKVKTEWRWAVTAFNIAKLVRLIAKMRAESAELAATC